MGHAFQHTLMDTLVRYHRMRGDNTLWQPGTDHAGIATQIVVERQLDAQGQVPPRPGAREVPRARLGVEGGIRLDHHPPDAPPGRLAATGQRERFTMDEGLSRAVTEVFVRLYERRPDLSRQAPGQLGPGAAAPRCPTSKWSARKKTASSGRSAIRWKTAAGALVVATTRPETMLGDIAVAVHPEDERYHASGRQAGAPAAARAHHPDHRRRLRRPEFGTGCVKITPAHDFNDYQVGQRHQLAPISVLTLDAKINDTRRLNTGPGPLRGAQDASSPTSQAQGLLVSDEAAQADGAARRPHRRGRRADAHRPVVREHGRRWRKRGLDVVARRRSASSCRNTGPHTYNHWLENIQDWCISRQLWWGHRIPAWYDDDGNIYVARSDAEAQQQARRRARPLRQDEDVLDTWFSSALWPFSSLGWPETDRRTRDASCRPRCWSPASTSFSSGSRA